MMFPQFKIINEIVSDDQYKLDIDGLVGLRSNFVYSYMKNHGIKDLVLGISGGIDSLVAGLICNHINRNSNKINLHLISLPNKNQHDIEDVYEAVELINPYKFQVININGAVCEMENSFGAIFHKDEECFSRNKKVVLGNTQARIRMVYQYMYAQTVGGLVVGTDHASEALTGFFTKYGDGGSDINPLSGLKKSTIYKIAEFFSVPQKFIQKSPAAGLGISETDEDELGITYLDIDNFLDGKEVDKKIERRIIDLYNRSAHKRSLPVCPEIDRTL